MESTQHTGQLWEALCHQDVEKIRRLTREHLEDLDDFFLIEVIRNKAIKTEALQAFVEGVWISI